MPKYHLPKLPIRSKPLQNSIYITSLPLAEAQQHRLLLVTIKRACLRFGPILSFKAPIDTENRALKGIIFVEYKHASSAFLAVYYLNDIILGDNKNISVKFVAPQVPVDISQLGIPQSISSTAPISYSFLNHLADEEGGKKSDVLKAFLVEKEGCIKVKSLTLNNKKLEMKEINFLDRAYSYCLITKEKDLVSTLNSYRNSITFSKINKVSLKLEDVLSISIRSPVLGYNFVRSNVSNTAHGSIYTLALFGTQSTQLYKINFNNRQIQLIFEIEHDYLDNNHNYFSFYTPHIGDKAYIDEYKSDSRFLSPKLLNKFDKENCNPLELKFDKTGTFFRYNVVAHISLNGTQLSISPAMLSVSKLMRITENKIVELVVKRDELAVLTVEDIITKNNLYKAVWDVYKEHNKEKKGNPIGDYQTYCSEILKENKINFDVAKKEIKELKDVSEFISKIQSSPTQEARVENKEEEKRIAKKNDFVKHFVDESSNNILVTTSAGGDTSNIKMFNNRTLKNTCHVNQNKVGICDAKFKDNFVYLRFISNEQLKRFYLENIKGADSTSFSEKQLKSLWLNVLSDSSGFVNSKSILFDYKFFLISNKTNSLNFSLEEHPVNVKIEGEIEDDNIYRKYTVLVDVVYQKSTQTIFTILKNPNTNAQIIKIYKVSIKSLELTEKRDLLVNGANNTVISLQPNDGNLSVVITKNTAFILKCAGNFEKAELNDSRGSNAVFWDVCGLFFCVFNLKSKTDKGHEENFGMKVFTVGGNLLIQQQFIKVQKIHEIISMEAIKLDKKENQEEDEQKEVEITESPKESKIDRLFRNHKNNDVNLQVEVIDVVSY